MSFLLVCWRNFSVGYYKGGNLYGGNFGNFYPRKGKSGHFHTPERRL